MDLKQLKTFICVAEAGSLSRASDRLRIAQPALSRQIKLLEHELGVALFDRHVRGMDLTEPGKELLARVSGLVRQLEQSVHDIQSMHAEVKGHVALGLMPTVTSVLAVRLVERVARDLPGVTLRLTEGYSGYLIEWLQRGDIDLTFLYGPSGDFHLRTKELLYEDIGIISPPGSLPGAGATLRFEEAAALPLALPSRPHGIRVVVDAAAESAGVTLNVAFDGDSFRVLKSLVARGMYHAFVPLSAVTEDVKDGAVEARTLESPQVRRQLILGMPADRSNTRATESVIAILTSEIASMIRCGEWIAQPGSDLQGLM
ncbi:LysR family transcriptional regulator [Pelagibius sp. Alg239-R121]|uniref:LysR family transcriptional regulator n=1 Tax=Pelagibius sp. Alg239-R121 TaxID=2993448 RepID=UPI0024A68FDE|nr:LysR family transcriptional regulator [Pelagibius sp. Alg239-R121]